jgi:TonB family protein
MNRSFRRVFSGTAIVHGAVVAVFLVVQLFLLGARPLKLKEEITMIDLSGPAGGGGGETGPDTPPPQNKVPDVKPPEDIPPPEPPKNDTIPEPVKPKPKPVKPTPKPTPKPVPQIKVAAPAKTNRISRIVNNRPKLSADQIRAMLNGSVRGVGGSTRGVSGRPGYGKGLGSGTGSGGSDSPVAWYYAMVKQIMYEAWQQPSGLANAGNPVATVTIRVKRDGTISDWQMMRPSGNTLMDDSVKRAVQAVKRLKPLPPQFIGPAQDITIQFELEKLLL